MILLLSLFACAPEIWTRAGPVDGVDAWVAVQGDGDAAIAYVCGGPSSMSTHTRWFTGADGGASLAMEKDGWTLAAELPGPGGPDGGTLTDPDGRAYDFQTADDADLFTAQNAGCRDGAIVRPGARGEAAAQGVWCDGDGALAQVTPIGSIGLGLAEIEVEVDTGQSRRVFTMTLMDPAELAE